MNDADGETEYTTYITERRKWRLGTSKKIIGLVVAAVFAACTARAQPVELKKRAENSSQSKLLRDVPSEIKDIKAYCIDFNWHRRRLAKPGQFANTDPAVHLAWYKMLGVNVIQTFCVSTNGYAWYKNGFVPAQPGLKHDFLPEMVKLGHAEGMLVMGYFTIGCNPRWAKERPDLSYGGGKDGKITGGYHIPYTDAYLDFLSKSIRDAVRKTGIDGFMIDWVWQPTRKQTNGKWIECEKKLYEQLMGEPYPGDDALTVKQELAYSLAAAGARQPKKALPGANLLPVMEGEATIGDRAIFGEAYARDIASMENPEAALLKRWVIHKQYKLIVTYDGLGSYAGSTQERRNQTTAPELYDLLSDPFEQHNLYGKRPKVYESLRSKIDNWYSLKERKAVK